MGFSGRTQVLASVPVLLFRMVPGSAPGFALEIF
jgi:hypothetical protein